MKYILRYDKPAPDSEEGWMNYSLPIGCSHLGANIFGIVEKERIQITENAVANGVFLGGVTDALDLYISFPHSECSDYERGLDISESEAYVRYVSDGVKYERKFFASYPDRILAVKLSASEKGKLNFRLSSTVPYLSDDKERGREGKVSAFGDTLKITGRLFSTNVRYEGLARVFTDGKISTDNDGIEVSASTDTYIIFAIATNYELREEVFTEPELSKKLRDFDPHEKCLGILESAATYTYDELRARHEEDYVSLFGRVSLSLAETEVPNEMTDVLLENYSKGNRSTYLESLYFQYGRYLLISSSRKGAHPANLQGTWSVYDDAPWGSGYWHNINIQMNYWPAFITNLAETFLPYADYNKAFRKQAEEHARTLIKEKLPKKYVEGKDYGWITGTACNPYTVAKAGGHSGPGTSGLTSQLFWDLYNYTCDKELLREVIYPTLLGVAKLHTNVVKNYDGKYLSTFSASPEQVQGGGWGSPPPYYHTIGCAFDQQMIWENAHSLLLAVDVLGEDTLPEEDREVIKTVREQIDHYDPVQVGLSGQIKEYREENFYGTIGEYYHRHLSHLVGLYPGTLINADTPAWRDAVEVSLTRRGDETTGWALAHRFNSWARCKREDKAYHILNNLLGKRTLPNLWDTHPPFQIDGNFGGTSGIAEMLLQSSGKYIEVLAALPDEWDRGEYSGLVARGGFEVSVKWEKGCASRIEILSKNGGTCRLQYPMISSAVLSGAEMTADGENRISFETEKGEKYIVSSIPVHEKKPVPKNLKVSQNLELTWDFDGEVNILRACNSDPVYTTVARGIKGNSCTDTGINFKDYETVTYKVIRADSEGADARGTFATVNHATALERDTAICVIGTNNIQSGFVPDWDFEL